MTKPSWAVLPWLFTLVGACGGELGPMDAAQLDDLSSEDGSADAGDPSDGATVVCQAESSTRTCTIDGQHPTLQSAIDDSGCARVCVPAGVTNAHLVVARAIEVFGLGASASIIDGGGDGRVLNIVGGPVILRDLSIVDGSAEEGGCINSTATLTIDSVHVANCAATKRGGGIVQHGGVLTLRKQSMVENNAVAAVVSGVDPGLYGGGGIYGLAATILVQDSSIQNNRAGAVWSGADASAYGGGVVIDGGSILLTGAIVSGNSVEASSTSYQITATGGGIACLNGTVLALSGTIVSENSARAAAVGAGRWGTAQGGGLGVRNCTTSVSAVGFMKNDATSIETIVGGDRRRAAQGGAISAEQGTLTIDGAVISENTTDASGDSIASAMGGALWLTDVPSTVTSSTITMNTASAMASGATGSSSAQGGAFWSTGLRLATTLSIMSTNVSNNTAEAGATDASSGRSARGGGIHFGGYAFGTLSSAVLVNTTVSGNRAHAIGPGPSNAAGGGAHCVSGDANTKLSLRSVTMTANVAEGSTSQGGGLALSPGISAAQTYGVIGGSIIAANTAGVSQDCMASASTTLTSQGYNLIGNDIGCTRSGDTTGDLVNVDPKLGPLLNNGGVTMTHSLDPSSPAVNAGRPGGCMDDQLSILLFDQRGSARPAGSGTSDRCDIGALEFKP